MSSHAEQLKAYQALLQSKESIPLLKGIQHNIKTNLDIFFNKLYPFMVSWERYCTICRKFVDPLPTPHAHVGKSERSFISYRFKREYVKFICLFCEQVSYKPDYTCCMASKLISFQEGYGPKDAYTFEYFIVPK